MPVVVLRSRRRVHIKDDPQAVLLGPANSSVKIADAFFGIAEWLCFHKTVVERQADDVKTEGRDQREVFFRNIILAERGLKLPERLLSQRADEIPPEVHDRTVGRAHDVALGHKPAAEVDTLEVHGISAIENFLIVNTKDIHIKSEIRISKLEQIQITKNQMTETLWKIPGTYDPSFQPFHTVSIIGTFKHSDLFGFRVSNFEFY